MRKLVSFPQNKKLLDLVFSQFQVMLITEKLGNGFLTKTD